MIKKIVTTEKAPAAIGPYSQAVIHRGTAYLSGQIPIDPATGQIVEGGIEAQTERVLENLKGLLEACGATLEDVLKLTVYLRDLGDFTRINEILARYFPTNPPARATIEAARLPRDARIEIDAIAAVPD
jgi:2-iminobutanoate/2-iminopropanoate deaminase